MSLTPHSLLEGEAVWACDRGRLRARLLLAPTARASLQALEFSRAE